jgi:hypothetical protein
MMLCQVHGLYINAQVTVSDELEMTVAVAYFHSLILIGVPE